IVRSTRVLPCCARREAGESNGYQRSERNLLTASGNRRTSSPREDCVATRFSRWGLDCNRLACHHGRCGSQRISCGGSTGARCWTKRCTLLVSRSASFGPHANFLLDQNQSPISRKKHEKWGTQVQLFISLQNLASGRALEPWP